MLEKLLINHVRILSQIEISNLADCNVFIGKNGSGKTSLLESLYILSRGKSFRHHQPKHYVSYGQTEATVFAKFSHASTMAVAKSINGDSKLRLNSTNVATQSEITRELPVILLDPTQLDVLDHGSVERRALLDWLVFHKQPNFYKNWLNYQRALKQRNRILREHESYAQLSPSTKMQLQAWNEQLAGLGEQIHSMRSTVMEEWQPIFQQVCSQFLPQYQHVSMSYSAGFDTKIGLHKVLADRAEKDVELGYTRVGVHRADVLIYSETQITKDADKSQNQEPKSIKKSAPDVFSRGEKKLLIMALKLSQLQLLNKCDKKAIVLLDDINAELDNYAVERLLQGLYHCKSQLFVTSLDDKIIQKINTIWQSKQVYKVTNGQVHLFENKRPRSE